MSRVGGSRRKRLSVLTKSTRKKGKLSIRDYLQELQAGDKVTLKLESSVHSGMYLPRFHGKSGVVMKRQGSCYEVMIRDGNKDKMLIVHPVHVKKK